MIRVMRRIDRLIREAVLGEEALVDDFTELREFGRQFLQRAKEGDRFEFRVSEAVEVNDVVAQADVVVQSPLFYSRVFTERRNAFPFGNELEGLLVAELRRGRSKCGARALYCVKRGILVEEGIAGFRVQFSMPEGYGPAELDALGAEIRSKLEKRWKYNLYIPDELDPDEDWQEF